jgi:DNA uptake protein ComE-like DNA-binding protein
MSPQRGAPWPRAGLSIAAVLVCLHVATAPPHPKQPVGTPIPSGQLQLRLDPNIASEAELNLLPRIGPGIAAQIVAYRAAAKQSPAFRSAADLDRVPRIGPATVDALRPYLRFAEDANPPDHEPIAP